MRPVTLDQVLACPNLPTLPSVALDVLALAADPNVSLEQIAQVIQNDQALTSKILRTVNSSFYGLATPCPTITRALTYLGLGTVKSLVLSFSLVDLTCQPREGFNLMEHWRRAIYSAAATRRIALLTGACDPEEAFICALIQDIGMPMLHASLGEDYIALVAQAAGDHSRLPELEQEALGLDHGQVGALLAERWRLPSSLVAAIRLHHAPLTATDHMILVRTVALGAYAAGALISSNQDAMLANLHHCACEWFGLESALLLELLSNLNADAREYSRLLQVDTGQAPDIKAILARAEEAALEHQLRLAAAATEAEMLRQTNSQLSQLALTDALTGLGNRKRFDSELIERFNAAQQCGGYLAVIMMDADLFKSINDAHGHIAGDAVLAEIARRAATTAGDSAIVCRYGGEEFAMIATGADRREAARLAESVRLSVCSTPADVSHLEGTASSIPMSVSVGVAVFEPAVADRIRTPQLLVHAADRALYAAKQAGRNCVRVFSARPAAKAA